MYAIRSYYVAGSYCVEALTDRLEAEAEQYIHTIDELGGMVAAIEQGYVQREIEQAAYAYGQSVETGSRIIVGVNKFREEQEPEPEVFVVPEDTERKQIEELEKTKSRITSYNVCYTKLLRGRQYEWHTVSSF